MAGVNSDIVNSEEVEDKCELCEERGGCRRDKAVTMSVGHHNPQLERLIQAITSNTRSLLGQPPETQTEREGREKENLMKEEQSRKVKIERENVTKEIGELIIFEKFVKLKMKLQEITEEQPDIF